MIPGNGIETSRFCRKLSGFLSFISMIPGNGIETSFNLTISVTSERFHINDSRQRDWNESYWYIFVLSKLAFISMIPGNGIETVAGVCPKPTKSFHINDSRQRDWNNFFYLAPKGVCCVFHINDSRQRDWNIWSSLISNTVPVLSYQWFPATGLKRHLVLVWIYRWWAFISMIPGNGIETFVRRFYSH